MAVSKRTRFEVLRRDDYTCRYCRSADNPLTIDHVVPVALGGSDAPANLVAACKDCNAGKSSATPDQALVQQVSDDAVRWARAMAEAADRERRKRSDDRKVLDHFLVHVWGSWTYEVRGETHRFDVPDDWESAILRQLDAGLSMDDLSHAVDATMHATWVRSDHFRYFMGVCKNILASRHEVALQIIGELGEKDAD